MYTIGVFNSNTGLKTQINFFNELLDTFYSSEPETCGYKFTNL